MKKILLILCLWLPISGLYAQQDSLQLRFAQLSFFYPLGTNGINTDYAHILSLNVLVGVNGGVRGVEAGSLANINHGDVYGLQASGGININRGDMAGVQVSSLMNLNTGDVVAGQFSEGININQGNFTGLSAGLINFNGQNTDGHQLAALMNFTRNNTNGAQIAPLFNLSGDTVNGTQIGLVNKARVLNGTQIGFVNIVSDSSENAVPIGIFNYTPDGIAEIGFSANEVIYGNLYFRFGGRRFYTLLKASFGLHNSEPISGFGIGLGTRYYFGNKSAVAFEAETNQFTKNYYWNIQKLDMMNSLSLTYRYQLTDKLAFSIGPAYNTYVTEKSGEAPYSIINVPYTLLEEEWSKVIIYDWIGGRAGFSFCF